MTNQALPTKRQLQERIARSYAALEQLLRSVRTDRLGVPGPDGWSVKDHIAHLAAWERSVLNLIQGLPRYSALDVSKTEYDDNGVDYLNERIRDTRGRWSFAQVMTDFQTVHDDLLEALERLNDEDLARAYSHYQPDEPDEAGDGPVVRWITENTCDHFDEHRTYIEAVLARV